MKFRPCIDLHGGIVKQIVGSTLSTDKDYVGDGDAKSVRQELSTNFSTTKPPAEFSKMYAADGLTGGHVIMLGPGNTEAAKSALKAYPGKLQVGGGITDQNCTEWLDSGASHVIVTSHVFSNGVLHYERLKRLVEIVGKDRLVLDLSCRRNPDGPPDGCYYVVTDKWQKFTECPVNADTLRELAQYCDEFLVHGVDVEGRQCGILEDLVVLLGEHSPIPVTYAGGVRSIEDMGHVEKLGQGKVDCTVGSALDIFGGNLKYEDVVIWHKERNSS